MSFCGLEDPSAIVSLLEQTPSSRFATNVGVQVDDGNLWDRIGSLFTGGAGNQNTSVGVFATSVVSNTFARIINDCQTGYSGGQSITANCDIEQSKSIAANYVGCAACRNMNGRSKEQPKCTRISSKTTGSKLCDTTREFITDYRTRIKYL